MLSNTFSIEQDLRKLAHLLDAQPSAQMTSDVKEIFSGRYSVEDDLSLIRNLGMQSFDQHAISRFDLCRLSEQLSLIEKPVFSMVADCLAQYQGEHPDSPLFSTATLFGPIEYGRLETAVTRALAWLIDSDQPHGFGCGISNLILNLVKATEPNRSVTKVTLCMPERFISAGKRIDIWAEGEWSDSTQWTLIIEAKIDASESTDQLKNYETAMADLDNCISVYLTPDGSLPKSAGTRHWEALSFQLLADALTSYYLTVCRAKGADFLRLFTAGLLRDVLDWPIPVTAKRNNRFEIADLIKMNFPAIRQ